MRNPTFILSLLFFSNNIESQQSIRTDQRTTRYSEKQEPWQQSDKLYVINSNRIRVGNNLTGNILFNTNGKQEEEILSFNRPSLRFTNTTSPGISSTQLPLLRNERSGIWKKVGRGELFIGGAELVGMVGLMLCPKEMTKWDQDWIKDAERNIIRGFTSAPVWDKDDWPLNYIGHPIAGSYYFNAIRSQNGSWFASFLFATAQSCIWEYLIEGSAEKPSIQDLVVTPVAGSIIGESTHQLTMNMRRNGFNFIEKVFILIFNPMFVVNNGFGPRFNPVKTTY